MSRIRFVSVAVALAACSTAREDHSGLRGPLRPLVETATVTATCQPDATQYAKPFWRAPYTTCRTSIDSGTQTVTLDADSVVVATWTEWVVPAHQQQARWDSAVAHLTALFGSPAITRNAPVNLTSAAANDSLLRIYCVAWRGPDSAEVTLFIDPLRDVGPARINEPWVLRRYARYGPLLETVSCGLGDARKAQ